MASVWPLVGRAEELRLINAAVTGADDYGGVVIAGPPGVGKSRLAHEAITHINPGRWVPRWARATTSARTLPLGAFAEWAGDLDQDPMFVVRGVLDHLVTTPEGAKVVVGVDDAHLLDDLSAFVVHQLVHRKLAKIVVTIRNGEPIPDAVTALWKDGLLQRVELQPLSEEETGELVAAVLGGPLEPTSAHRLWNLTRGNTLYLRHLIEQELSSERLSRSMGVWVWTGQPVVSPGLAALIDTQIGALPDTVGAVLDSLAVGEPLAEQLLADLTSPGAVEAAHASGLITVERCGGDQVRLAHPLYGEARRAQATPLRLRHLRSLLATALGAEPDTGERGLVRRAVLTLESDLAPDPQLFTKASLSALSSLDADLSERLASAAIASGAGYDTHLARSMALALLNRGVEADEVLAQLSTIDLTDEQIVNVASLRTGHLLWMLNRPAHIDTAVSEAMHAIGSGRHGSLLACQAVLHAYEGRPLDAEDAANRALRSPDLTDVGAIWALGALLIALGDLGRTDQIGPIAARTYDLVAQNARIASPARLLFCDFHIRGLILAGYVGQAHETAAQMCEKAGEVPGFGQVMSSMLMGPTALAAGYLTQAQKWLEQPFTRPRGTTGYIPEVWFSAVAQERAIRGDHAGAMKALHVLSSLSGDPVPYQRSQRFVTRAWVSAASGAITQAIEFAHQGAAHAAIQHQHAHEVMCLHTATRFGDTTTAHRLHEIAEQVDGPRAPAAAQHATALAADEADDLFDASKQFEELGDLLSAIDAAAHAATAHRHHGRNGSALAAAARAQRLANICGGAITPALREAQQPSPLTARQREIVTLAAHGLTNKQIAEKLTVSVRTIEGHLYRASLKTGATGRDDLGATITGD